VWSYNSTASYNFTVCTETLTLHFQRRPCIRQRGQETPHNIFGLSFLDRNLKSLPFTCNLEVLLSTHISPETRWQRLFLLSYLLFHEFKYFSRPIFRFVKLYKRTARSVVIIAVLLQVKVFWDITSLLLINIYRR
jgi:hypothetical protein